MFSNQEGSPIMKIGFLIPTDLESQNLPPEEECIICAGYGAGKAAACSAAAELIYEKNCDTILIWGLAGGLAPAVQVGDILIGTHVAYKDYNIYPLMNSTGVGYVQDFAEELWHELDCALTDRIFQAVTRVFPGRNVIRGGICTGDQFVLHQSMEQYNRIEQNALAVDMESAAVAHFCYKLKRDIRFGVIRVISDNANHSADQDFTTFLQQFSKMNCSLSRLREVLEQ
jgi:adenosylhomocysteine nucleosidase